MKKTNYLLLLLTAFMLLAASCGKDGAVGPQGPPGPAGPQGPAGANGTVIYSGTTVPSSTQGATGDFYIDLSNGTFYGPKLSTGWGTGISLVGPTGATGATGTNGTNGTVIYSGTTVPPSATGNIGDFYIDLTTAIFYGPKTTAGWGAGFSLIGAALGPNYPIILNTIVTPAVLDTLKAHGTIINAGLTPPTVNGIYLISPNYCLFDNSGGGGAGKLFANYEYEFTNESSSSFAINVNFSDKISGASSIDAGSDVTATYISGNGSSFTIYAQITGTQGTIPYTELQIISGQIVAGAINNFQLSFYLESKTGDSSNTQLVPVGTTRIFKDEDGVSLAQSVFTSFSGEKSLGLLRKVLR